VVGVKHQADRRADRLAHGADQALVLLDAEADLELDRREALFDVAFDLAHDIVERIACLQAIGAGRVGSNAAAQGPAHQHMDRRLEVATLEVPERDVDARQGGCDQSLLPLVAKPVVEVLPVALGGERVVADEIAGHGLDHRRIEAGRPEALAPPRRAILRDDLDEARRSDIGGVEAPGERLGKLCLENMSANFGDAHGDPVAA
jgi:hypothetical protein